MKITCKTNQGIDISVQLRTHPNPSLKPVRLSSASGGLVEREGLILNGYFSLNIFTEDKKIKDFLSISSSLTREGCG